MARRELDDDWDDFEEYEEEEEPGLLTTGRILVALLVLVVVVVAVARLLMWEKPAFAEVTPRLFGLWTTTHPEFNDQYVEFEHNRVIFGTGGTGVVKFKVSGMDVEKIGDIDHYTVFYRDLAGAKHFVDVFLDEPGEVLRFTDSAEARWTRFHYPE
ncbi:MAG: hypothetical protein OEV48_20955 [Acidobacteriota bacterium]|nr:hypothetical protein [Acidobacteriota bacterium]